MSRRYCMLTSPLKHSTSLSRSRIDSLSCAPLYFDTRRLWWDPVWWDTYLLRALPIKSLRPYSSSDCLVLLKLIWMLISTEMHISSSNFDLKNLFCCALPYRWSLLKSAKVSECDYKSALSRASTVSTIRLWAALRFFSKFLSCRW